MSCHQIATSHQGRIEPTGLITLCKVISYEILELRDFLQALHDTSTEDGTPHSMWDSHGKQRNPTRTRFVMLET